ncbi:MAG TPA: hypothetical protein VKB41_05795 [Steroidobacteraceae bacterium]|nr:hypothetical protein [Steroidobacteraceae bacterium]
MLAGGVQVAAAQSAPGTAIRNTGQASYTTSGGAARTVLSNEVVTLVEPPASRAAIELLRPSSTPVVSEPAGPTECLAGSTFQPLPNPVLIGGQTIDPTQPIALAGTASYHGGEPLFVRLVDADQNRDATVRDSVVVQVTAQQTGDRETLRLTETTPTSGIFVGYVQTSAGAATPGDCTLQVARDATLSSSYVDPRDATDTVAASAAIDPTGLIFDSHTGQPVDGVRIRLVDATTGAPAVVRGDDGVSTFPSEIVTGSTVTDSGGSSYTFAAGTFRFPVVNAPGSYRYELTTPVSYRFPSTADPATLQTLPNAPFTLNAGSFGNAYTVAEPSTANLDVPLDPTGTRLFLQKSTLTTLASPGDFVQYTLMLENPGTAGTITATHITDILPAGLRYQPGSTRVVRDQLAAVRGADPQIAPDGRTLTFDSGDLGPGQKVTIRYVAAITLSVKNDVLTNRASATGAGNLVSNPASSMIRVQQALNSNRAFIMGRVVDGGCNADALQAQGVEGVRVYLEDGRYSVTDSEGKYHFEDVTPGSHVVQMDTDSIADTLEPVSCGAASRHADRAYSQFVDVRGGSLWRADFNLTTRKPPEGNVSLTLDRDVAATADGTRLSIDMAVEGVAVGNLKALVMLPEQFAYVPGSASADGKAIGDAEQSGSLLTFRLGEATAHWHQRVSFAVQAATASADAAVRAMLLFDSPTKNGQKTDTVSLSLAGADGASAATTSAQTLGVLAFLKAPRSMAAVDSKPHVDVDAEGGEVANIESLTPGIGWELPREDFFPVITSIKAAVRHLPGQTVELRLNGSPVSPLNFYGTSENQARTVAVDLWRGVDIPEGPSQLVAIVRDAQGVEVERLERAIHFGGGPVRAEYDATASTLVADGRTHPLIRIKVTDAYGKPARRGTLGTYQVDPPHRSSFEVQALTENQLVATGHREPTYAVEDGGVATIELEPTTQSGQVVVHLKFSNDREQEIRAWLTPAARDWVVVGIAEGTAAYQTISQNSEAAHEDGIEEGMDETGRVAFFAKGRIRGDFLLTMAYDSARDRSEAEARLQGVIEPNRYYTLYGDATEQRNEAASQHKLYLKLERRQFYALFGDFDTGLTVTELSRYSRSLSGLHTEYAGKNWSANAFAADSAQGFVKDELRGDGTSGLYHLSHTPLVIGSDKLRIEVRDRFHTEQIVDSRTLTRFLDYSLDYERGELFFKEPVPDRDSNFNPVFIIVEYETAGAQSEALTAGGRAAVKLAGDKVELGATFVHEGAQAGDRQLAGADMQWKIGAGTEVKAEVAQTSQSAVAGSDAHAYVAELTHQSGRADAHVYVREQEQGFGLGQQLSTESGTRKYGADGRVKLTDTIAVQAEAYQQEYIDSGNTRDAGSAEVHYQDDVRAAGVGLRHVSDQIDGEAQVSDQAYVNGSMDLFDKRVRLRASAESTVGGNDSSPDFPARAVVGADWRATQDMTLFSEFEHAEGESLSSNMTRVGVRASPWERAEVVSSFNAEQSEFGPRTFANLGLTQGVQLGNRWAMDFGVDQSRTITDAAVKPISPQVPLASGDLTGDFFATYAGASYRGDFWKMTSRLEYRNADLENRVSLTTGLYREPIGGHAFSLSLFALNSDLATGNRDTRVDLSFGWAYRPTVSRWILLNRLDLITEDNNGPLQDLESWRAVDAFNANWKLDEQTQVGLQFGTRYNRSTIDSDVYSGYSDLYGFDVRRDLGPRFDVGVQMSTLNSWSAGVHEYSLGADLGINIARNVWIAVGYNFAGFHDEDFSRNRYTDQGPFIKLRIKADQDTFRELSSRF